MGWGGVGCGDTGAAVVGCFVVVVVTRERAFSARVNGCLERLSYSTDIYYVMVLL